MIGPKLVGILNITPDSFSDGGLYTGVSEIYSKAVSLIKEGADIIEIGAESTRPNATLLTANEEWDRLKPALNLLQDLAFPICLDTYHIETMKRALDFPIRYINDVSGFQTHDKLSLLLPTNITLITMHNLGIPANRNITLSDQYPAINQIMQWAQEEISRLISFGFARDRIVIDPGIGYGKSAFQSLNIIKNIDKLAAITPSLLLGHSRKSFFEPITHTPTPADRDPETIITSIFLARHSVAYLRIHNVSAHVQAFKIAEELKL